VPAAAAAGEAKLKVVATFSILADLVTQVGGERVTMTSLVGPDADAHGYSPAPGDARRVAEADLVVVNGLGFEGWIERLIRASGTKAPVVTASSGITTIPAREDHDHDHTHGAEAGEHPDPHAWQSVANVKIYVTNIRDALAKVDPDHAADYAARAEAYRAKLHALENEIRTALSQIPEGQRRVITTHDSFGYYAAAYGLRFLAPQGISTNSEAGPKDVARIIRQIRRDKIPAVFVESIADPRLMQQIARESGAKVGGRLFSDALSGPTGSAPTYLDMMRSNLRAFREALS
jgi:zinc/manganese transport system substrate-binding protein